ncbi:MAG: DUF4276 family protein [Actinomycetota bacterium]|nr:DUF4276 family protein [Actinomycetota bacterium]
MSRVVFLLEEFSMKVLLDGLLPRLFPSLRFLCVSHEGKQDLERSVPRKLRAWREPGVRFVVVRDNDGSDCREVKRRLAALAREGRRDDTLVRIACQELEAWYLGAPDALAQAFGREELCAIGRRARFRDPDTVDHPARALVALVDEFQKVSGARRMAQTLTRENRSRSFQVLISAIEGLAPRGEAETLPAGGA